MVVCGLLAGQNTTRTGFTAIVAVSAQIIVLHCDVTQKSALCMCRRKNGYKQKSRIMRIVVGAIKFAQKPKSVTSSQFIFHLWYHYRIAYQGTSIMLALPYLRWCEIYCMLIRNTHDENNEISMAKDKTAMHTILYTCYACCR